MNRKIGWIPASIFIYLLACVTPPPAWGADVTRDVSLSVAGMLDIQPSLPEPGEEVQIGAWIENRGTQDAYDVSVYFYEDGVCFDREETDVRAQDSVFIRAMWMGESGDRYISVVVDPDGEFLDDKGDNREGAWVVVR
jgi:hypothetical protein